VEEKKPIVTRDQAYEMGWRVNARCAHGKLLKASNPVISDALLNQYACFVVIDPANTRL
jgi:hypothetical protein